VGKNETILNIGRSSNSNVAWFGEDEREETTTLVNNTNTETNIPASKY
jgi:hypothetical protein